MSGGARVYVGRLGRVDPRDIEVEFGRFGRIERVDMKQGFCFVVRCRFWPLSLSRSGDRVGPSPPPAEKQTLLTVTIHAV